MSSPTFVVLPVSADDAQHPDQNTAEITSAIQETLHKKAHPEEYKKPEHPGPLKQIIAHQDSLYKYISWENLTQTLGSYVGLMGIIFGAHYLPLTQTILKAAVAILGVVSVAEFASRSFGPDSLSTRLRPKEYKTVPEETLNATLKDIHDLIQFAVVQGQKILFGQDLDKTFGAFLGLTVLYWLIKVVSPFWLAVIGLTSIYIIPLVASPRGRAAAHDASVRAQDLASAASETGQRHVQNGKAKVAELSSAAQEVVSDGQGRIQNLAQSGKETVADLSGRAKGSASDMYGAAAENVRTLPQTGASAINKGSDTVDSSLGQAKRNISSSLSTDIDGTSDENRAVTGGAVNEVSQQPSNGITESAKQKVPEDVLVSDQSEWATSKDRLFSSSATEPPSQVDYRDSSAVSSLPGQTDGIYNYAVPGQGTAQHGIMDRPRGSPDGT
ncbi:hypothetical protein LTR99_004866 [Exophiala xenobiotica]|uniref:Reticulon domain-containing protein n=1 Tax=Vermiconidia calcicola TaxID=1690605 RepID=A0AAV9QC05_9PEZI|nr:hypothetical protein LTR96_008848 [Exophiala xenobiotica]KAK5540146.1 hypothetical protein LTR25_003851 [Vermiconidia calcicola]KAK5543238.1 hypothetical protein LTR23_005001 [Chaetothyriales sp. CCFEE 6169]KAK5304410.1 hypothetical protein LTR99_004866 [Exophiala xenobiotica]KAK5339019.1 hypothetical protein LTR98_005419 [Exophiala xenobiotica]